MYYRIFNVSRCTYGVNPGRPSAEGRGGKCDIGAARNTALTSLTGIRQARGRRFSAAANGYVSSRERLLRVSETSDTNHINQPRQNSSRTKPIPKTERALGSQPPPPPPHPPPPLLLPPGNLLKTSYVYHVYTGRKVPAGDPQRPLRGRLGHNVAAANAYEQVGGAGGLERGSGGKYRQEHLVEANKTCMAVVPLSGPGPSP